MTSNTPTTLKITWARATRFASRHVPIHASTAVTQVPMLAPRIRGIAAAREINPCWARTITTPVKAVVLCIAAVKAVPIGDAQSADSPCRSGGSGTRGRCAGVAWRRSSASMPKQDAEPQNYITDILGYVLFPNNAARTRRQSSAEHNPSV